jgi:hypothetical protein
MNDFAAVLAPRSDQINASDLLAGDMVITIAGVKITPGTEQPVSIRFEESEKVWRPCKTTGRILMAAWGPDTAVYVGRQVQLYLDPKVRWGGLEVGGIRIRALSHIDAEMKLALAESKQARKLFTIRPLAVQKAAPPKQAARSDDGLPPLDATTAIKMAEAAARKGTDHFRAWFNTDAGKDCRKTGALTPDEMKRLKDICEATDKATDEDPFGLPPLDPTPEELARAEAKARAAADALAAQG